MYKKTPLESWILAKIEGHNGSLGKLTRSIIETYQIQQLRETLTLARDKSPFYRRRLARCGIDKFQSLKDLGGLPFTTPADIRQNPLQLLCVSQDQINRVVTLDTSGTTGLPKRIYFTAADQELTRDFFQHGMSTLVQPGDKVLILLPGYSPGSVGDLLADGLRRMQVKPVPYGVVRDPEAVLEIMAVEQVDSLVGIPTQVLALARCRQSDKRKHQIRLKSLLLSTDHVPGAIVRFLEETWGCRVFNHYGMTEMGLGGGVECEARAGYHLREADLLFEIINPLTGEVLPEGEEGEVVFTTLTRRGMPLIRYRTGDIARFMPEPCPCGTVLKRMSCVRDRVQGRITLTGGELLSLSILDEVLFAVNGVVDFEASLLPENGRDRLAVRVLAAAWAAEEIPGLVEKALFSVPVLSRNIKKGNLILAPVQIDTSPELWKPAKRIIRDNRNKN
ncbi:Phenylacetate-coenzyme A ligase [Pelotomaculum schinkii]|uniref:Phenylacetate-coenzyme A ligase n=1 Tax=Pelotomaculum schinkii TaxID=78350 RepID=A0A4Y7RIL8_9FIRM|nr:AMP-binding protein [Pelotomaculum schinkii]TEB08569.1 Phenylacetate-coenzyme A ligase [Pelotomaculum schinkii]